MSQTPFIMPDGRSLAQVLRADKDSSDAGSVRGFRLKSKSTRRGKDLQYALIAKQRSAAASNPTGSHAHDINELRALESVGVAKRRRWLNDRILREMAGPMTLADIEKQFKPMPFGWREPSALELISAPQHAQVWDGFRTIDSDKQERVLQRWEEHNRAQSGAQHATGPATPAAAALHRWSAVSKKARQALRKANIHSVLGLEAQMLEFLEAGVARALTLKGLDGWGRLLVHGLADFYGLSSSHANNTPSWCTPPTAPTAAVPAAQAGAGEETAAAGAEGGEAEGAAAVVAGRLESEELVVVHHFHGGPLESVREEAGEAQEEGQASITVWHRASQAEVSPLATPDLITCTDVLMALAHSDAGSLSAKQLATYVRKELHGSETGRSEGWVVL